MYHLEKKPAVGGMPTIETAPRVNAAIVSGMRRPMPARPPTLDEPVARRTDATLENSAAFMTAWFMTCSSAATSASGVPMPSPTAIMARLAMLLYASMRRRSVCAIAATEPSTMPASPSTSSASATGTASRR